jgi:Domain of unknown function (DUF4287)/Domain of unknown function (DUF5655)
MTTDTKTATTPGGLSPRQEKWFASVRASLERDTGKSLSEWVAIAKTCPETKPRARAAWLKANFGLLQNRAMYVLNEAFPSETGGWAEGDALRDVLWTDPASRAILEAVQAVATALPGVVMGQRKQFTAFSREFQFVSVRPVKGGKAMLGLALTPSADPRLEAPKNESWSERLKARLLLDDPKQLDPSVQALVRTAWERS